MLRPARRSKSSPLFQRFGVARALNRDGCCCRIDPVRPAFCSNDEIIELRAVLAGEIIAQLAVPTVAALIRSGRLVPLLIEHMTDSFQLFLYYGSRQAQPARVRRFIDLAVERLGNNREFVLSREELSRAAAVG